MNSPSAILFDLDGVLVRSEEAWFHVVEEAGRRFRGSPIAREDFDAVFGQGTDADVRVFGLKCTVPELDRYYIENLPRYVNHVEVDPAGSALMRTLVMSGFAVAIVTNTVTPLAEVLVAKAGVRDFVHVLAGADQVPRPKPAPDLVVHALGKLGFAPNQAWMIGDSRYDREAAGAAGVRFIGLRIDGDERIDELGALAKLVEPHAPAARMKER